MLLTKLRSGTSHLHERVERAVGLAGRLGSLDTYGDLLARYYGFYHPLEDRLTALVGDAAGDIDLGPRLKTSLLVADLLSLGRTDEAIASLPLCGSLPSPTGLDETFGCLYVLEGATLGGQIVRKEVMRLHGLTPDSGCAFFSSYGENVGPMWRGFCAALEAHALSHPETHHLVVGGGDDDLRLFRGMVRGLKTMGTGPAGCSRGKSPRVRRPHFPPERLRRAVPRRP
ncbi:biliverdin-producing heme oxygenase [Zavarzinella formosa]|uniref:biliverdin-producing heme oxygenase n=1 Tax=Zavarzinella formosa TaxID=360055 RepID=UPI000A052848|nr:biliverdin-producing heme oxygenase [Zavarzinella formosa]